MSDEQVDQILADIEMAVESLRSDYAAVVSLADQLDDEVESLLEHRAAEGPASTSATPRPRQTHLSLRLRLAEAAARQHREALCGLVAWWADAAVVTVMVTAQGRKPDPVRIAAPDPYSLMTAEDLEHLPPIPENDRQLAELALFMAGGPALPGDPPDFADKAKQHIQSVGLTVKPGPGGAPMLVEDVWPEPRRCRLWGAVWQEHQMPLLPSTAQLTEALTVRGIATETIDAIREASSAVETQLAAKQRFAELERQLNGGELSDDDEKAAEAEILATPDLTEKTDELLIAYARTLTQSLPAMRAAAT
ncbi:hypothetical protein [Actinomadura sp. 3N508]|uniref:hypothetical protein n=1 Tax=Actinomadura sp. 3N508 TaxID=3375153 RepID=UPI0037B003BD